MDMAYHHHPDYDSLPEAIKYVYTAKEYAWMGDEQRAELVENECMPDPEDFDV